jgi:hypothetical protein
MKYLFLLFTILLITNCTQHKCLQYTTVQYKQTYCADAWATGDTDSITAKNVVTFLTDKNISVRGVNIENDGQQESCKSCVCYTGKTIYIDIFHDEATLAALSKLGFKAR